ncbi:hypothetical protein M9H77_35066 [Catharanthus roseus]|uniref:Uncharacterized protein n=1 Tax=Catharanthus roseus TaxID=4058 RepID=A0ACB9ZQH8_CATRO|nr:hypothetical protein M9H77_35066 [Catharanthus roseus]
MVSSPFPNGALGTLAIGLRRCLGHCLTVRLTMNGQPRRVIVKFGRAFEICDPFPHEVDSHLVAPDAETALWYWSFGVMCSIPQFDGFIVLVVFLIDINELEESSNEEDGM